MVDDPTKNLEAIQRVGTQRIKFPMTKPTEADDKVNEVRTHNQDPEAVQDLQKRAVVFKDVLYEEYSAEQHLRNVEKCNKPIFL